MPSSAPNPVTPAWLRARLDAAGATQGEAARLLEVDARTARRWCLGESIMPRAAAILLDARLYLRAGDRQHALEAIAE